MDAQLAAILRIAPLARAGSANASNVILVARSRSSSGYFFCPMTVILPCHHCLHQTRDDSPTLGAAYQLHLRLLAQPTRQPLRAPRPDAYPDQPPSQIPNTLPTTGAITIRLPDDMRMVGYVKECGTVDIKSILSTKPLSFQNCHSLLYAMHTEGNHSRPDLFLQHKELRSVSPQSLHAIIRNEIQ